MLSGQIATQKINLINCYTFNMIQVFAKLLVKLYNLFNSIFAAKNNGYVILLIFYKILSTGTIMQNL